MNKQGCQVVDSVLDPPVSNLIGVISVNGIIDWLGVLLGGGEIIGDGSSRFRVFFWGW